MNTKSIDFGKAITYPFDDKDWPAKLGILLVLDLIPLVNLIIVPGYLIITADNIWRGVRPPLPQWVDYSGIARRGLIVFGAAILYHVPLLLLACFGALVSIMAPSDQSGALLVTGIQCCLGFVVIVYVIGANAVLNVGHVRYLQTGRYENYTDIAARIRDLRAEPNLYGMLIVYQIAIGVVLGLAAVVLAVTCIGPLLLIPLYTTINAYLLASAAAAAPLPAMRT